MENQFQYDYKWLLDANEMAFNPVENAFDTKLFFEANRYPDATSLTLRTAIAELVGDETVTPENLIMGSGSDEVLKMAIEAFVKPFGSVIIPDPSFSEYEKLCKITYREIVKVPCEDFTVNIDALIKAQKQVDAELIILANPNNPTGKVVSLNEIQRLLDETRAWVLVDEAYMEFATCNALPLLKYSPKLLVTRTLSKAYGLAALRIGYLMAQKSTIELLLPYKMTYNISGLSESVAIEVLRNTTYSKRYVAMVKSVRRAAITALASIEGIRAISSEANFILIQVHDSEKFVVLNRAFLEAGIKIRFFPNEPEDSALCQCIRITLTDFEALNDTIQTIKAVML